MDNEILLPQGQGLLKSLLELFSQILYTYFVNIKYPLPLTCSPFLPAPQDLGGRVDNFWKELSF